MKPLQGLGRAAKLRSISLSSFLLSDVQGNNIETFSGQFNFFEDGLEGQGDVQIPLSSGLDRVLSNLGETKPSMVAFNWPNRVTLWSCNQSQAFTPPRSHTLYCQCNGFKLIRAIS